MGGSGVGEVKKARFGGSGLYLLPLGVRQRGLPGVAATSNDSARA